jgi:hypothetical protein
MTTKFISAEGDSPLFCFKGEYYKNGLGKGPDVQAWSNNDTGELRFMRVFHTVRRCYHERMAAALK